MAERHLVLQISDTHLLGQGLLHGRVDSLAAVEAIAARITASAEHVDAIVMTGDLAERGERLAYLRLRELMVPLAESLGALLVVLPGNHDEREVFRDVLLDGAGSGPIDQVREVDGLRIVALDSTVAGAHHGELSAAQLALLAEVLSEPAPSGTLVALHHPPIFSPVALVSASSLRHPEALGAVITGRDVLMVLAGHGHHATAGALGGVPVWVAASSAYQSDVMGSQRAARGLPGAAFSRIDILGGCAFATHVAMSLGAPIYEHCFAGMPSAALAGAH